MSRIIRILVIVPLFIIFSLILQISTIFTDFSSTSGKYYLNGCKNSESLDSICVSSKVFIFLSAIVTLVPLFIILSIVFCSFDINYKLMGYNLFKNKSCMNIFKIYYNSLIIVLPIILGFQIIGFALATNFFKDSTLKEGFFTYLFSFIFILISLILHPIVSK
jgi:hypothetical protein